MRRSAALAALVLGAPLPLRAQLYVPNQDDATVSVIDPATRRLLRTVDLRRYGVGDNAKPHHVQVEPDGSAWYVTLIGAGKVLKLDPKDRLLGSVDLEVPGLIALHPSRDLMFVGRSMSAVNPPPRIGVIRRSDMKLLDEVDLLFPRPHGIAVHPAGAVVYVASLGTNQIASVGVDQGEVRLTSVLPEHAGFGQPHGIAISPDGSRLFVGNRHQLGDVHDHAGGRPTGKGTVVAICVRTGEVETVVPVGHYAAGLGMTPALPGGAAAPRPCP